MNKAWWTEEEHKQRIAAAAGRGDLGRELIAKGEFGRALLSGVTDPATPQRQTTPHRRSAERPAARADRRRPSGARSQMRSGWSLPGEDPVYDGPARLRLLGQLPHARHALVDDAVSLQRRLQDLAGAGRRRLRPRDDPRRARHLHRRPAAADGGAQAVHGRVARTLGGQHARHRDDQLQGRPAADQPRRRRVARRESLPASATR